MTRLFAVLFAGSFMALASACTTESDSDPRMPVGVLGDSDSHSYHDSVMLSKPHLRGGKYRDTTFQWTEIWMRLRANEVDLGEWGAWGARGRVAALLGMIGLENRAPRKKDYRFNLAYSGAVCEHLMHGMARQTERLVYLMNKDPERWSRGVVVIRIGINSIGKTEQLDQYARTGPTDEARAAVADCMPHIRGSVALIRATHPKTRIVLVGIFDDAHWAKNLERWNDPASLANIGAVMDLFDDSLRQMASNDPDMVFADERAWFTKHWGGRGAHGEPAYKAISFGGTRPVTNSVGDSPDHSTVADGHGGTVGNGLWLSELILLLNSTWNLGLTPIQPDEIARLADPAGRFGIRPVQAAAEQQR